MLTPTPNPLHDIHHETNGFSSFILHLSSLAKSSPLLRQAVGAAMGALVALVMYEGFAFATPYVQNMLAQDSATEQQAIEEETQDSKMDRVSALANEKLEALRASAPEMFEVE